MKHGNRLQCHLHGFAQNTAYSTTFSFKLNFQNLRISHLIFKTPSQLVKNILMFYFILVFQILQ